MRVVFIQINIFADPRNFKNLLNFINMFLGDLRIEIENLRLDNLKTIQLV